MKHGVLETYGISVQSMNGTDVRMTDVMRVAHQPFTTKKLSFKMNGAYLVHGSFMT